jgi:uracil-DNA glycosylase family 4
MSPFSRQRERVRVRELAELHAQICRCRACPRLVAWREEVGRVKRRAYRDWDYWARPVPGFGEPRARLVIIGLAPGAHGANRTGRMFTGDRSGDFLYSGLFRAGFASQPTSEHRRDGLELRDAFITAPVRCVPPANRPAPEEISRCAHFLDEELALLRPRVFLALGAIAWAAALAHLRVPRPRPAFAHGASLRLPEDRMLIGCYHVSQQNTQTGRLTAGMFDAVLARVSRLLGEPAPAPEQPSGRPAPARLGRAGR